MNAPSSKRKALIVPPDQGRRYSMGRMTAIFKAYCAESDTVLLHDIV